VVQGLTKLQGIHQGLAVPVFNIKPVNAVAFNQKADDLMIVLAKPYLYQASPVTQEKGPAEQIRGFNRVHHLCHHLLPKAAT